MRKSKTSRRNQRKKFNARLLKVAHFSGRTLDELTNEFERLGRIDDARAELESHRQFIKELNEAYGYGFANPRSATPRLLESLIFSDCQYSSRLGFTAREDHK